MFVHLLVRDMVARLAKPEPRGGCAQRGPAKAATTDKASAHGADTASGEVKSAK